MYRQMQIEEARITNQRRSFYFKLDEERAYKVNSFAIMDLKPAFPENIYLGRAAGSFTSIFLPDLNGFKFFLFHLQKRNNILYYYFKFPISLFAK